MSDIGEQYRALGEVRRLQKRERRNLATKQYKQVKFLAEQNGFKLQRFTDTHYRISCEHWELNLYPGNLRIHRSKGTVAPMLDVPKEWTLTDIVEATMATGERNG